MRILIALTYYHPHKSGLTIYVKRLAKALATRKHIVTVLTSQYDPSLPCEEVIDGVKVIRIPVGLHVSKGVLMPGLPARAWQLIRQADVVNLHVPQFDAFFMAFLARLNRKPVVLTYHCDLLLPHGLINAVANIVSNLANRISIQLSQEIVTNTLDFARHSPYLRGHLSKIREIHPPIEVPEVRKADLAAFREKFGIQTKDRVIGMVARLATEKGVEYLVEALPAILAAHPNAKVYFVGQFQQVMGEERYAAKLAPMIAKFKQHWNFLGVIPDRELGAFYRLCDVLCFPSINSTDSFGMVQVEAIGCGRPVVASDLPGIRQPALLTEMGRIVPARDAVSLAREINDLLDHPLKPNEMTREFLEGCTPAAVAIEYERIFKQVLSR